MHEPRYSSRISRLAGDRRGRRGSFGDLGPGELALAEWAAAGLEPPDVDRLRADRLERLRATLAANDCGAIVVTDPINIRYATDSTNMSIWTMHNAVRYAFVATEGPVVVFDFHGGDHLSSHLPLVDETRPALGWFWFNTGPNTGAVASQWAGEIAELMRLHGAGGRLAVDKVEPAGVAALAATGLRIVDGQEVCEVARSVKSSEEITAMRCAIAATESAIAVMESALEPGITEQDLWSHLHSENIRRGGEWIETRLLSSGPRTNPWFSECSARTIEAGDLVAFDTDLVGPYGYCCDISRTWICGDRAPSARQRDLYRIAVEQIEFNASVLRAGMGYLEFAERSFELPARFRANRYSCVLHGVGLCDEYPAIVYAEDAAAAYDGVFEPEMTVCLESYVGEEGGPDGVKIEEQYLITADGLERLSSYPLDGAFLD